MPKTNQTDKKVVAIFKLMEYLLEGREISPKDPVLLDEFGISYKTLERYLKDIEMTYGHIITVKRSKTNYYKMVKASDILMNFIKLKDSNIGFLFDWLKDESIAYKELEEDTKKALQKISVKDKEMFIFKSYPFEEFSSEGTKEIFDELKIAVKNNEYRDIEYLYDELERYKDAKCLKLVFVDNNWYIAIEDQNSKLKFLRISFIKNIKKVRDYSFQKSINEKYIEFFKTFQNSLTLYGEEKITARLLASPKIAKYFQKDMKKFYPSQKYIGTNHDGSIEFSLEFTQPLEILPFIKRWIPDIKILSPKSLQDEFEKDLKKALS